MKEEREVCSGDVEHLTTLSNTLHICVLMEKWPKEKENMFGVH